MTRAPGIRRWLVFAALFACGALFPTTASLARDHDYRARHHDRGDRGDRHDRHDHHDRGHRRDHDHTDLRVSVRIGGAPAIYAAPPPVYESVYEERTERVWVEPVYRTVCDRVWIEPIVKEICERVWVEPVYEVREVIRYEGCWNRIVSREHVLITPGHWEERRRQVVVREGRWETIERQELVTPGHWEYRTTRVAVEQPAPPPPPAFEFAWGIGYRNR
jgi:hypothetical protein